MRKSGSRDAQAEVRRALYLESVFASGRTSPNPDVACVVDGGDFFFRGSTEPPGGRHAEIVALDQLESESQRLALIGRPDGASTGSQVLRPFDMSVTLEPCSTYGRTPPCSLRIARYAVDSDFARETGWALRSVSIAYGDPSLALEGRRQLERAGLTVNDMVAPTLYQPFLAPFFQGLRARRPLFVVKVATDRDGLLGIGGRSVSITGAAGRILTMRLRARCDAVLVGPGTTAVDRPSLDLRGALTAGEEGFLDQSSFEWLDAEPHRHRLAWFRGLFEGEGGWDRIEADATLRRQFQPVRVFLLGRPFPDQDLFFERQRALEAQTGRPSVYLALRSHRSSWPGFTDVPDLNDPSFLSVLGDELAGRGLQRVLVESGKGMLGKWASVIGPEDMLVHVRNSHTLPVEPGEIPLRLEKELARLSCLDNIDFGSGLTADLYGREGE